MAGSRNDRNDDALTLLYRQHYQPIRSYARCLVDPCDVDDVVADTFVVAFQRGCELPAERERAWLLGVTRNVARTRRRSRDRAVNLARLVTPLQPAPITDLDAGHLAVEEADLITTALGELARADAELVVLATWHGLTITEPAAMLGIPNATARVRLHRARARFIAIIDGLHQCVDTA